MTDGVLVFWNCTFCGVSAKQARGFLIVAKYAAICEDCVGICTEMLVNKKTEAALETSPPPNAG